MIPYYFAKNLKIKFSFLISIVLILIGSCKENPGIMVEDDVSLNQLKLPLEVANYADPSLPYFFKNQFITIQNNTPQSNPTTNWGATLGRVLFYDTLLSINNTISCGSCHQQSNGFADSALFSIGFNGGKTGRHSMALANAAYYSNGRFFWDERAASLEEQVLEPIQDPIEMGMTMAEVISRLNATEHYPVLFEYAFGTNEITNETVAKALAQFVRSMVSYTSKYDQGRILVENRTADFPNFTQKENRGKKIFMTHDKVNCFGCHNTDVFITDNPRNNGLNPFNIDEGIYVHTQNELDRGKFKAPSLKNVALRGRFMHDGGLSSLREVIEHYNSGIQMNPNLDSHLIDISSGTPVRMNLSNEEMEELEAFLNTLTDEPFLNDVKYSNPFK